MILYAFAGVASLMSVISYWFSDKLVIASTRAKEVTKETNHELLRIVENLSITAGLPSPRVYIVPEKAPNAFATGRDANHAVVAVTEGLLEKLDRSELEGVIAHELSHIGNRDMLLGTVIVVLVGFVSVVSDVLLRMNIFRGRDNDRKNDMFAILSIAGAIIAPIAATLIQLAVSRKREFLADASGALLTRYPEGLANALIKISADQTPMRHTSSATAHLWLAEPVKGKKVSGLAKMFMTHPPVEERVKALMEMGR
jgi:heat shock protein HtpX